MGQQQLLLLVLGVIIVGAATVVGLQAFAVNQKKANSDALLVTALRIASDAQRWLQTPQTFGGGMPLSGDRPDDFGGVTVNLTDLGYDVNGSDEYQTVDGNFTLDNGGTSILIEARSVSSSGGGDDNNLVCVLVDGLGVENITTTINPTTCS